MGLCGRCASMMQQQSKNKCTQCGQVIEEVKPKPKCLCDSHFEVTYIAEDGNRNWLDWDTCIHYCPECGRKL